MRASTSKHLYTLLATTLSLCALLAFAPRLRGALKGSSSPNSALKVAQEASLHPKIPLARDLFSSTAQEASPSEPIARTPPVLSSKPPLPTFHTPSECHCANRWGAMVKVEGLYWTARGHHLTSGITLAGLKPTNQLPPSLDRYNFLGEVIRLKPNWHWGVRAGLKYTCPDEPWNLRFDWTCFRTQAHEALNIFQLPALNLWGYPDTTLGTCLYGLESHFGLDYNFFALDLGHAFEVNKRLNISPHFGIAGALIDQKLSHRFDYETSDFIPFGTTLGLKCDFAGAGLQSGLTLCFVAKADLEFYGKVFYRLLYGKFDISLDQVEFFADQPMAKAVGESPIAHSKDGFRMGVSSVQGVAGVSWRRSICALRYRYGFNAQWEFNQVSDINKFSHFFDFLSEGVHRQENASLVIMGITFGGTFDF